MDTAKWIHSSTLDLLRALDDAIVTPYELLDLGRNLIYKHDWKVRAMTAVVSDNPKFESGILNGLPVAVKDTLVTKDFPTVGGSPQFLNFRPNRDATPVATTRAAGALFVGKTNVPELAMDYQSFNKTHGISHNPYDLSKTPGGSSGGSAAGLAMRYFPLAFGSDLAGSLRQPASFCGVYSLRPTIGSIPPDGHLPGIGPNSGANNHVATVGPMAIDLYGVKLLWYAMKGENRRPDLIEESDDLNLLVSPSLDAIPIDSRIPPFVLDQLSDLPIQMDITSDYSLEKAEKTYIGLFRVLMEQADTSTLGEFLDLQKSVQQDQLDLFEGYDAWILPVASVLPFSHNLNHHNFLRNEGGKYSPLNRDKKDKEETLNYWVANGMYCRPVSASGFPTITIPLGMLEGMPQGIQIIGKPNKEEELFTVANTLDKLLGERIPLPPLLR